MAYKCEIFEAVKLKLHGYYRYVCTVSYVIDMKKEKNMSAKQGIHKQSLMRKDEYGCQIHSIYAYYC